ncbi:AI-2E family transporter [Candidatus Pacearchaeota archaeon]|nr:AI-2E family transporter [Candidatus Pacearchaeota archaeon]
MNDDYLKRVLTIVILVGLLVLSFFILKSILLSIVTGLLLAFIFIPVYEFVLKKVKNKDLAASIICLAVILLVLVPMVLLTPVVIKQSVKIYFSSQQIDFVSVLEKIFPDIFDSDAFSSELGSMLNSFITKTTNSLTNALSQIILNFPELFLKSLVVFFTFYFAMRDRKELLEYIQSLLPFDKSVEKKLFESSKAITVSVLYGQVIIGVAQGLITGIGYFIFGVPNALFLSLITSVAGIFPIIGPTIVWIPVSVYLMIGGNTFQAIGVIIFGIIASSVDNLIRPVLVSQRSRLKSSIALVGMIGGFFFFGILGFIIGPLILAYTLIILEIYRKRPFSSVLVHEITADKY